MNLLRVLAFPGEHHVCCLHFQVKDIGQKRFPCNCWLLLHSATLLKTLIERCLLSILFFFKEEILDTKISMQLLCSVALLSVLMEWWQPVRMLLRTSVYASQLYRVHFSAGQGSLVVLSPLLPATPGLSSLYSHSLAPQYNSCFPH
ncbi:uncharacterized protein BDZ99DRAFT_83813 [Mytilinidion resinicola]|uniref:Uncharacterized protein n=1 Tax=Mytilinidion resinicola TaxID=574789 RepID=A0A6A6YCY8_9PEZI|nr:uncharacterized protein BDZ99DRAFT_83813 [Mytilinidion resinicola]KAF2806696.1 hypothetical protein BDZ99DRAFT_83813 [Mytilinidion resinicola]